MALPDGYHELPEGERLAEVRRLADDLQHRLSPDELDELIARLAGDRGDAATDMQTAAGLGTP